jgi:hypothetical protein
LLLASYLTAELVGSPEPIALTLILYDVLKPGNGQASDFIKISFYAVKYISWYRKIMHMYLVVFVHPDGNPMVFVGDFYLEIDSHVGERFAFGFHFLRRLQADFNKPLPWLLTRDPVGV